MGKKTGGSLALLYSFVLVFLALSTSCDRAQTANTGNLDLENDTFLYTDYLPLTKWLDERYEIDYREMKPDFIFDQAPLDDIYYEFDETPSAVAPFSLRSENISRRELLQAIADFWEVEMRVISSEDGTPRAVGVTGF